MCDPCELGLDFGGFATSLAGVSLGLGLVVEVSLAGVTGVAHVRCATCFAIELLELGLALSTLHTSLRLDLRGRV